MGPIPNCFLPHSLWAYFCNFQARFGVRIIYVGSNRAEQRRIRSYGNKNAGLQNWPCPSLLSGQETLFPYFILHYVNDVIPW